jgi:ribosomal protein L7/L12
MTDDFELDRLRQRVVYLETKLEFLYTHLGLSLNVAESPEDPRILELVRKGKMIEAIKMHREIYKSGLIDAKRACEEIKNRLGL